MLLTLSNNGTFLPLKEIRETHKDSMVKMKKGS
jgi:hypothetical protein